MGKTLFKEVNYRLSALVEYIDLGQIGLPDIQRPFVWPNTKVRDLFDSMYRGFPVGYLLFWQNGLAGEAGRAIGADPKQKAPDLLVVDGQQRLTSLYAVIKGIPVVRGNYAAEHIEIAFSPLHEKFAVADAATRRDRSYIPSISKVWREDAGLFRIAEEYLRSVRVSREISADEERRIQEAITSLYDMRNFPFVALELSASVNEEEVAEIFVRINSKGKTLNQADFILTLMSVFWDEGRSQLEDFCRRARSAPKGAPSPFNYYFEPDPDHLLRVAVGLGFRRARLQHVYSILRGKDLDTQEFSDERRVAQFDVLKRAQAHVLNLTFWHDFLKAVRQSGHRSKQTITSPTAVVFAYTLYLLGRTEYGVEEFALRRVIARWFFMSALTARYSGSPETRMEYDLARLRPVQTAEEFVDALDRACDEALPQDYWDVTLPGELAVSSARSPAFLSYLAALSLLDARALYSQQRVRDLLDPSLVSNKSGIERHHLFPKAYLAKLGFTQVTDTNQVANYALVEWADNVAISDQAPAEYAPALAKRFPKAELTRMYYWHALPENWHAMDYPTFLARRRELIARVIADGHAALAPSRRPVAATERNIDALVRGGESSEVEFKGTLRTNLHTNAPDERITWGVLRTIAAFLNQQGGALVVGVLDDGDPVGYQADGFRTEDEALDYLTDLLTEHIGAGHLREVHPRFEDYDGVRVLVVECWGGRRPAYLQRDGRRALYVRDGATCVELTGEDAEDYIAKRFTPTRTPGHGPGNNGQDRVNPGEVRKRFWAGLLETAGEMTSLHANASPRTGAYVTASVDRILFSYGICEHSGNVSVYIDFDRDTGQGNKCLFDALLARRQEIEGAFGGPLEWNRFDEKRASSIRCIIDEGGWRDEDRWPELQRLMAERMARLETAMRPVLAQALY